MRESYVGPLRRVASFALALSMVLGMLFGAVQTAYAEDAPAVGTIWLVDSTFTMENGIWYDAGTGATLKSQGLGNGVKVELKDIATGFLFKSYIQVLNEDGESNSVLLSFVFPDGKTKDDAPDGIKVLDGTGTKDDPIRLGLYYTPVVTSVTLDKTSKSLAVGHSGALTATVSGTDLEAEDKKVTWSVTEGADKVKLFSDSACENEIGTAATATTKVYVKGTSVGSAKIKVTSSKDSTKSATCDVTVNEATTTYKVTTAVSPTNGGTAVADKTEDLAEDEATTITATPNKGYVFSNWSVEGEGARIDDTSSAQATLTMGTADATVTANFEEVYQVIVTNDGNGSAKADKTEATVGDTVTLTATPNEGYEFDSWECTTPDVIINDDAFVMPGSDVEVKAKFKEKEKPAPVTYTVTAEADPKAGGTATASKTEGLEQGATVQLVAEANDDYEFVTWKVVGKGATLDDASKASATLTVGTADVTATAVFRKKSSPEPVQTATLTFDLNGGTLSGKTGTMTITATVGETIKLPRAPTRSGYTFKYWKGSEYAAGADYEVEGDHTFKAMWEKTPAPAKKYTVSFDANGGTGSMASLTREAGTVVSLPANAFTRSGYKFLRWNTKADGTGTSYGDKATYTFDGDATLYAQWAKTEPEPARTYPNPTMTNSRGGTYTSTTETITYTVSQLVPTHANSFRTWVKLEDVLTFTTDASSVVVKTTDGATVGRDVASVSISGQTVTVTVSDATSLRNKTLTFSYTAKLRVGANLSSYIKSTGIAEVPFQAHTVFNGNESDVKHSEIKYVKFRVSGTTVKSTSTAVRTSTPVARTLASTGDPASLAPAMLLAISGAGLVLAGKRRR